MLIYSILLDALVIFVTTYGRDLIKRIFPDNKISSDIITDTIVSGVCVFLLILKLFI